MNSNNKFLAFFKEWVAPFLMAFVLYKILTTFVFFNAHVPTGSMIPTLNVGDKLFTTIVHNTNKLNRGDIVVFKKLNSQDKEELYVKRLIGLPGDVVDLKSNGQVYVNGNLLDEPYVKNQINELEYKKGLYVDSRYGKMKLTEYEVPEGKYFFIGDNRDSSCDARYWKEPFITKEKIVGKVIFKIWPLNDMGIVK